MTADDVQKMFNLRFDNEGKKVWMLPQDVIDNTILAYSVSPTSASGYCWCVSELDATSCRPTGRIASKWITAPSPGPAASRSLVVTGPMFQQHDLRVSKRTRIAGTR